MTETRAELIRSLADWLEEPPDVTGTGRIEKTIEALRYAADLIDGVEYLIEQIEEFIYEMQERLDNAGLTPYEYGKFVAYEQVLDALRNDPNQMEGDS